MKKIIMAVVVAASFVGSQAQAMQIPSAGDAAMYVVDTAIKKIYSTITGAVSNPMYALCGQGQLFRGYNGAMCHIPSKTLGSFIAVVCKGYDLDKNGKKDEKNSFENSGCKKSIDKRLDGKDPMAVLTGGMVGTVKKGGKAVMSVASKLVCVTANYIPVQYIKDLGNQFCGGGVPAEEILEAELTSEE